MPAEELDFEQDQPNPPPATRRQHRAPEVVEEWHPSDEEAQPAGLAAYRTPLAQAAMRTLPFSIEAEEHLLSCCLLDGPDVVARCKQAKIRRDSFYSDAHGIIYDCVLSLMIQGVAIDASTVAEELKKTKQLDAVGGYAFIAQVSSRIPTTAQAGYFIERVRELAVLRAIIKTTTATIEKCYGFTQGDIDGFMTEVESDLGRVTRTARGQAVFVAKPLAEMGYPSGDDPNILLGRDDYLGRGGGMLFVSHAGAGKSSFIADACMCWALGQPWVGITCNGPLKTLIVGGEDSERYLGKVAASFAAARSLSPKQLAQLKANCLYGDIRGVSGEEFFVELERLIELHAPDLVVINPIYLYAGGDISKSEIAGPFLVRLDRINSEKRFGYILVHHTGKPQAKGRDGKRAEVEDWETIYMGFGSSYLANWPRCSALLEPKPGQKGKYLVKLGKAGFNAGVTVKVAQGAGFREEPVTRIDVKWSKDKVIVDGVERPMIYWERDEELPAEEGGTSEAPKPPGRKRKFAFSEFREVIASVCTGIENGKNYNTLYRVANELKSIGKGAFNDLIDEGLECGVLRRSGKKYFI